MTEIRGQVQRTDDGGQKRRGSYLLLVIGYWLMANGLRALR